RVSPGVAPSLRSEPRGTMLRGLLAAQTIFASGQFILAPSLARDLGQGAEGLGVLLAASGAGAVVGGARRAPPRRHGPPVESGPAARRGRVRPRGRPRRDRRFAVVSDHAPVLRRRR